MTFSHRLEALVSEHRSANAFATHTGIGQSLLRKYLAGGNPGLDKLVQIAKATGVSITWLATGEGPRDSSAAIDHSPSGTQNEQGGSSMLQIVNPEDLANGALILVPQYDVRLSAGPGAVVEAEDSSGFAAFSEPYLRSIGVNPRSARLMQVRGRSQFPTLNDGEWVIVDISVTSIVDDGLYAVSYGDSMLVKRVQMMRDGGVILSSDNKAEGYVDERIPRSELHELRIVGRVKQHHRLV